MCRDNEADHTIAGNTSFAARTRSIDFFLVSNETAGMKDDVQSIAICTHFIDVIFKFIYQCSSSDHHCLQVFPVTHQTYRIHTHSERKEEKEDFFCCCVYII